MNYSGYFQDNEGNKYYPGIVESGSNDNGNYIKFSDGTLIQRGEADCPANVGYAGITFPIPFIDNNYIMIANNKFMGETEYGDNDQVRNIVTPQNWLKDKAYIYAYFYDHSIATYKRRVQYIAIGKWK